MAFQRRKRAFALALTVAGLPVWLAVVATCAAALGLAEGRPVFYRSTRRVHEKRACKLVKFRTMVRNADKIANRDTVPIGDVCFLNIDPESALYTPIGRLYERLAFTELPQLFHVLSGKMSLVGNRPLPENVISALVQRYPYAEERFSLRAGLTGPVQLVGRENLSDRDRLALEIAYCIIARSAYSMRLDFLMLLHTVLIALKLEDVMDVAQVRQLMIDSARGRAGPVACSGTSSAFFAAIPATFRSSSFSPEYRARRCIHPSTSAMAGCRSMGRFPTALPSTCNWPATRANRRFPDGSSGSASPPGGRERAWSLPTHPVSGAAWRHCWGWWSPAVHLRDGYSRTPRPRDPIPARSTAHAAPTQGPWLGSPSMP